MDAKGNGPGESKASFWNGCEDRLKELQDMKSYYERMAELCQEAIHQPDAYMRKIKKEEIPIPSLPKRTLEKVLLDIEDKKEENLKKEEQMDMLEGIFPDCERSYLRMICDHCNGSDASLMEGTALPSNIDIKIPGVHPPQYDVEKNPERARPHFPSHWEPMADDESVKMVKVDESSAEYQRVAGYLRQHLSLNVHRIERVQNPYLWEMYQNRREFFLKRLNRDLESLNERYLWHGTRRENVSNICAKNLDWRHQRSTGALAYGQGTYLANDPLASLSYAPPSPPHLERCILLARVLVGKCAPGRPQMSMPPNGYETTVDNVVFPRIFVKYHEQEIYPEYVLYIST
ncbi:unnamed protein product [Darwinula stevensoni]|uniref:Poly [ADP-ribose] polymerase n=1 Tax=Darwinula stevensoni TaxID=69355 RepID=A0A7R9FNM5_9CRUS|nr:unnamed protein product [Darwinula stevensoni]CAG0896859.1 unnamed protein product [Darwinula stevensoni]